MSNPQIIPDLTDGSADHEEAKDMSVKMVECREGGAGKSNDSVWRDLAEHIMVGVQNAQLPLQLPLDDITEGDGNCYFRALRSQLQRPDVAAPEHIRHLDHRSLRREICKFVTKSSLPIIQSFKKNWFDFQLGDYEQYWKDMGTSMGDIWAEGPVIHATAWFLERDINIVSEQASMDHPYLPFSGNQDGSDAPCFGAALWLGHLTGKHYQTLMPLPTQSKLMPPRPQLRKFEDSLKAKAKASGGDDQPGTSTSSRAGEVRMVHFR